MSLHPPIRVCSFKTNTVCLLSGRVSCQPDWFPRKEVPVGWLLLNKCIVSIIQAFAQIPFACYRKNVVVWSCNYYLIVKQKSSCSWIYNRFIDINAKWSKGGLFCLSCLFSPLLSFSQVMLRCQMLLNLFGCFVKSGGAQSATWSCYPQQPLLRLTGSQRHIYSGWH